MTSRGVTTRSQAKLLKEGVVPGRQVSIAKRKSTTRASFMSIDDENVGMPDTCAQPYGRRSFPLEQGGDSWSKTSKKVAKTDTSTKQKRALWDMGGNNYVMVSREHTSRHQTVDDVFDASVRPEAGQVKDTAVVQDANNGLFAVPYASIPWTSSDMVRVDQVPPPSPMDCLAPTPRCEPAPPLPEDVPDIDAFPDSLKTSVYSKDVMGYLFNIEGEFLPKPDFLDTSPDVTARMRGVLMDWLIQVQSHEDLCAETLHLCVSLIDRYLGIKEVTMPRLQLLGVSALLIASKFAERFSPEVSVLCYLTDSTYAKEELLHFEKEVLYVLQFRLSQPVCTTFLGRFLQVHPHSRKVEFLAKYVLDLSLTHVGLVSVLPSMKAAGSLYLARHLNSHDASPAATWTPGLVYYTNYTAEELADVVHKLATLLLKAPASKFQGARNRYNNSEWCYISNSQETAPEWVAHRLYAAQI